MQELSVHLDVRAYQYLKDATNAAMSDKKLNYFGVEVLKLKLPFC